MTKKKDWVLRTCIPNKNNELESKNNFIWPRKGLVSCPDWDPKPECGHGLHGLLHGEGAGGLLNWKEEAVWMLVSVDSYVKIDSDKVKFPGGKVLYAGTKQEATRRLKARYPLARIAGAVVRAGDRNLAIVGDYGTATAGDYGNARTGENGTATAGDRGQATAGYAGTATAGDHGTAIAENWGTATTGNYGTSITRNFGRSTTGNYGIALTGQAGAAITGDNGKASAGMLGRLEIEWWDSKANRHRKTTGYIGKDGIKANIFYKCNKFGELVKA